ncbi:MAG: twin-arginine translocase subunit TatC [Muribaculaceae bacterium]|nr:twin-arginine translocase subunit TatC [Muribaculaceae bacterium]
MNRSTFWDHAEALRGVLLQAVAAVVVLTGVCFAAMPRLFDRVILAPCHPDFPLYGVLGIGMEEVNLINIRLASQFFVHVSTSVWLGAALSFPIIIFLLWGFVSPGLYDHEKRGAVPAFTGGCLMFFLGMATGYFLVFPLTLRFLADYQLSALIPNQISLDSYIDTFMMTVLVMGIVFELPVVAWLLGKAGVLRRGVFSLYRRHAIVALLIIAAVVTPSGDPLTLLVVFTPVYILWELSALTVPRESGRWMISERDNRQQNN